VRLERRLGLADGGVRIGLLRERLEQQADLLVGPGGQPEARAQPGERFP
jgi:hypothetical protein